MPDTPTPNAMAAAEEIFNLIKSRLEEQLPFLQFHEAPQNDLKQIVAIITRRNADAERVLRVAAEWAAKRSCPAEIGEEACPNGNFFCTKSGDNSHAAHCWLEYWKKEAARE